MWTCNNCNKKYCVTVDGDMVRDNLCYEGRNVAKWETNISKPWRYGGWAETVEYVEELENLIKNLEQRMKICSNCEEHPNGPVPGLTDEMIDRIYSVWGTDSEESELDTRISNILESEYNRRKFLKKFKGELNEK